MRRLHELGLRAENPSVDDVAQFDMKPDLKTAIMAEISRGKAAGFYDKKEKVKDKSIDNLYLEEVTELLDKMRKNVIIDQTPTELDIEDNEPNTVQSDDQSEQGDQQIS